MSVTKNDVMVFGALGVAALGIYYFGKSPAERAAEAVEDAENEKRGVAGRFWDWLTGTDDSKSSDSSGGPAMGKSTRQSTSAPISVFSSADITRITNASNSSPLNNPSIPLVLKDGFEGLATSGDTFKSISEGKWSAF